ncbi:inositol polyphosphate multikinase [Leuresthes tenuis]|uniref:inositol polyphosphate multikinase n=1 Tax=Leuresthes tenuis TaxID=355514 RepID=UPI003B501A3F
MSSAQQKIIMESSVALGKLEVTPGSGTGGVSPNQRLSGSTHGKEKSDQRPQDQSYLNGCVPLSHQVAGHKFGVDKVGILQHPDGTVLKQVQPPPRGPREMQFYSMVYAEDCFDPCLLDLQNHLPKYYGTWSSPDSSNDVYLKLEDVTRRFSKPCIMDVKLGQQSYDPFASQEKREQQIRKYPLMEEIGFLILGMRVYNVRSDRFDSYDQHYGRGLVKDTVKEGLAKFFHNGVGLRKDAISASIRRVQRILHWFDSQHQLAFYASSLLFVYEGLPSSSLHTIPPISPTIIKTAKMLVGDGTRGQERKVIEKEMGQEKEVAEYNNNIQLAATCDFSLVTIYSHHRKGSDHRVRSHLHNCRDDGVSQVTSNRDSGDSTSALCEGDNVTWQQTSELKPAPHGNGNKAKNEDGDRDNSSARRRKEEVKGRADAGQGSTGDADVEVRMIDFAHVFPSQSLDQGYIYGLKHLLTVLEQILCDAAHCSQSSTS